LSRQEHRQVAAGGNVGKGDRELINKSNPEAPENRRVTIVNLSR
jgi:flagellar motor protein MotB